jgi:hypothetical protein
VTSVDDRDPPPVSSPVRRGDPGDNDPPVLELDLDRHARTSARRRARRGRRLRFTAYGVLLVALSAAIPTLAVVGLGAVLDSRDGEVADPVVDPSEPGYQAVVPPTPTLLVAHADGDGVAGLALLVLAGAERDGGTVVLVPPDTEVDLPGIGTLTIDASAALSGVDSVLGVTEQLLHLSIDDVVVLDAEGWRRAVEPVGGLTIENPDELTSPDGTVVFPAGPLALAPADVGPYLAGRVPGEDPEYPRFRQELVWRAWLDAVGAAGAAGTPPGEVDAGLGRFVPTIAAGVHRVEQLPATAVEVPVAGPAAADPAADDPAAANPAAADPAADDPAAAGPVADDPAATAEDGGAGESVAAGAAGEGAAAATTWVHRVDDDDVAELVNRVVPFPAGADPGDRIRVRVLDGTGDTSRVLPAARTLVTGGAQIVLIGNADRFDYAETVVFHGPDRPADDAEAMAATLGLGTVREAEAQDEDVDVTVVLGADYQP